MRIKKFLSAKCPVCSGICLCMWTTPQVVYLGCQRLTGTKKCKLELFAGNK